LNSILNILLSPADHYLRSHPHPQDYHATLETDTSPSREDFFLNNGDSHSFSVKNFALTYSASQEYGNGTYNFAAITEAAYQTIQRSIALNGQFFFIIQHLLSIRASFPMEQIIFFVSRNDQFFSWCD
jgi:hypothetical protein